jgi:GNAT superfamily N-acetyltransferase
MTARTLDPEIRVRVATLADIVTLGHHRAEMFRDMGQLTEQNERELTRASESFFRKVVGSGEYIAWLAVTIAAPERVVAGAGLWLRPMLPRPTPTGIIQGREALIANVYTEPDWRRRGVARLLMRHVLDYTREHDVARVLLHASDDGRPLYETLGFEPTNEMKLVNAS